MRIYKITNLLDGKIYVGATTQALRKRMLNHRFPSESKRLTLIQSEIRKQGEKNFTWEVIEECDDKEVMQEREKHWISKLNSLIPHGYNIESGGFKAKSHLSTKIKLSQVERSAEWRNRLSEANKGKKPSENQIRALQSGWGRSHSKEEILSVSGENNARAILSENDVIEMRRLYATNTSKSRRVKKEYSQDRLARMFGVKQVTISAIVRGKTWKNLTPDCY